MAAVLPSARLVQVGTPATTFATIINTDSSSFPSKLQISVTHSELGIVQRVGLRTAVSWSHAVSMRESATTPGVLFYTPGVAKKTPLLVVTPSSSSLPLSSTQSLSASLLHWHYCC
jgi:hypothetical protein